MSLDDQGGRSMVFWHHDRLAVMIEELGLGHHKTPCPACKGSGHGPQKFLTLFAEPCRRCHGLKYVPLGSGADVAVRMAIELKHIWRELTRLQAADRLLRANGLRVDQPDPGERYRP